VVLALVAAFWFGTRRGDGLATSGMETDAGAPAAASVAGSPSIAVLAFADMSSEGDQEYLSDGIAEELLGLLARIPELKVISRSSAFSYKGKDVPLSQVAEELGVAHILEGSVRKAGDQVRITAQLIEAGSDTHLWSGTYDRTLDDIFAIQDEIAAAVVTELKVALLGDASTAREPDPEAYALYLQARHLGRLVTAEGWEQSKALLEEALAIDPDYLAAWDRLSRAYTNLANNGLRPRDEGCRQARAMAEKALAIDPDYAPAHARLGYLAKNYDGDLVAAARHYQRALELDPTDIGVLQVVADFLMSLGRVDQAITLFEYLVTRDPMSSTVHSNLGIAYMKADRWDDAIRSYRTSLRLSPGRMGAHYGIGNALLLKDDPHAALEEYAHDADEEYRVKGTALALHAQGRQEEYEEALAELIERWGDQWPSEVAHVHAMAGDADAAFAWLEKEIAVNGTFSPGEKSFFYTALHDDPRWLPLLERSGASPAQLDAIEFKVTLPGR
jgi:TolB-like protein/Tfp pilus assembly protein PilF